MSAQDFLDFLEEEDKRAATGTARTPGAPAPAVPGAPAPIKRGPPPMAGKGIMDIPFNAYLDVKQTAKQLLPGIGQLGGTAAWGLTHPLKQQELEMLQEVPKYMIPGYALHKAGKAGEKRGHGYWESVGGAAIERPITNVLLDASMAGWLAKGPLKGASKVAASAGAAKTAAALGAASVAAGKISTPLKTLWTQPMSAPVKATGSILEAGARAAQSKLPRAAAATQSVADVLKGWGESPRALRLNFETAIRMNPEQRAARAIHRHADNAAYAQRAEDFKKIDDEIVNATPEGLRDNPDLFEMSISQTAGAQLPKYLDEAGVIERPLEAEPAFKAQRELTDRYRDDFGMPDTARWRTAMQDAHDRGIYFGQNVGKLVDEITPDMIDNFRSYMEGRSVWDNASQSFVPPAFKTDPFLIKGGKSDMREVAKAKGTARDAGRHAGGVGTAMDPSILAAAKPQYTGALGELKKAYDAQAVLTAGTARAARRQTGLLGKGLDDLHKRTKAASGERAAVAEVKAALENANRADPIAHQFTPEGHGGKFDPAYFPHRKIPDDPRSIAKWASEFLIPKARGTGVTQRRMLESDIKRTGSMRRGEYNPNVRDVMKHHAASRNMALGAIRTLEGLKKFAIEGVFDRKTALQYEAKTGVKVVPVPINDWTQAARVVGLEGLEEAVRSRGAVSKMLSDPRKYEQHIQALRQEVHELNRAADFKIEAALDPTKSIGAQRGGVLWMPASVVETVARQWPKTSPLLGDLVRSIDILMSKWKTGVLGGPGRIPSETIGDYGLTMLKAGPIAGTRAFAREMRREFAGGPPNKAGVIVPSELTGPTQSAMETMVPHSGLFREGVSGRLETFFDALEKAPVTGHTIKAAKWVNEQASRVEKVTRRAMYTEGMISAAKDNVVRMGNAAHRLTVSWDQIAKEVDRMQAGYQPGRVATLTDDMVKQMNATELYIGAYGSLGAIERNIVRAIPFWRFQRTMMKLGAYLVVAAPEKAWLLKTVERMGTELRSDERKWREAGLREVNETLQQQFPIDEEGQYLNTQRYNPAMSAFAFGLNPALNLGLDAYEGKFSESQSPEGRLQGSRTPSAHYLARALIPQYGNVVTPVARGLYGLATDQDFPATSEHVDSRLLDPRYMMDKRGRPYSPVKQTWQSVSQFFGLPITDIDTFKMLSKDVRQRAYWERAAAKYIDQNQAFIDAQREAEEDTEY